jgi:hypothetical protein
MIQSASHWNAVYSRAGERGVSWHEDDPTVSLRLMEAARLGPATRVIDIGGGESRLADALLARGIRALTVLDVSSTALAKTRDRLGGAAAETTWIEADVIGAWTSEPVDIWHDRAVFHFLIDATHRQRYCDYLEATLCVGGSAVIATFAPDGPEKCSGLPVVRYTPDSLGDELGARFSLVESLPHRHVTPWGATQSFQYSRFIRTR